MSERKPDPAAREDGTERVFVAGSMHEAFAHQIQSLLENPDLSEDDRQRILTGLSCPCCGGAASLTVKLGD